MRRLSSRATFWYKRIFPVIWFGFLGVLFLYSLISFIAASVHGTFTAAPFLIMPVVMMAIGYVIMKKLIFDLVDEVEDGGDSLIVKNGERSDRIALADIMNVNYSPLSNPPRVTLMLRKPSVFGNEVSFCAPIRFVPFASHPLIDELIRRVGASRERVRHRG